ncbi:MAG: porin [Janthinobacterium lividum]
MKKSLFAIAALSLAAGAAHAQSSVTLYGIIDAGLTYTNLQNTGPGVNNASHNFQATSGNLYGSRWGLKGTEDLGGGTSAVFNLENGFNIFNGGFGQGGQMFGRQAYVGLSNMYGTITAGRQYDSMSDFLGVYSASNDWATSFASHFGDIDNINQSIRLNNALKYLSPSFGGLTFGGVFGFGNTAGNFSQSRTYAFGASYAAGPFSVGAGYMNLHNPLTSTGTSPYSPVAGRYEGSLSGDYVGLQVADSERVFGVGGSYAFGPATVNLLWTRTQLRNSQYFVLQGTEASGTDIRFDNYEISGKYMLTDAWLVGVSYTYTDGKADNPGLKPKFHQITLGTNYSLSKRTTLYLVGEFQKAAGDGIVFNGTDSYTNIAEIPALADSGTDRQVQVTVGIKHSF